MLATVKTGKASIFCGKEVADTHTIITAGDVDINCTKGAILAASPAVADMEQAFASVCMRA